MLAKIGQYIETNGINQVITKTFQRGLKTIESKVAKCNGKTYFKSWKVDEYKKSRKICQSYEDGKPIPNTKFTIDYFI